MSEVTFPRLVSRGCGIDVHQKVVVATIEGEGLKKETREFDTFTSSLTEMRHWLETNGITHVAMESTGVFWVPVYTILERTIPNVWIVNARHIKYVPGHKTDKKDSAWISKLLLAGLLEPSFIPPLDQRNLRELTRRRRKLVQEISSEKNRLLRVLEQCNIKLKSVMSHMDGKVATKLLDRLCSGQEVTMEYINSVYHGSLQATREELYEACRGKIENDNLFLIYVIKAHIHEMEKLVDQISERVASELAPHRASMDKLKAIPGFDTRTVEDLVAEIGFDMSKFPSAKHLGSWAGLCPGNNESAGKKKSGRITHGNKQVKAVMTEAAWAATRTKNTFYSERYHRIAARRGKKCALIAVAYSMLTTVYNILVSNAEYNELGAEYVKSKIEKRRKKYLTAELSKLGYEVQITKKQTESQTEECST
jgi:transposase